MQSHTAMARTSATGQLVRGVLLLGALQCKLALAESFSSKADLKAAVNKVVAGLWSGDDSSTSIRN